MPAHAAAPPPAVLAHAAAPPVDAASPWRGREQLLLARERQVLARERAADARAGGARPARRHGALSAAQIAMLQQANANLVIASMEAVTLAEQVQEARNALLHQAHHDALTGLPNRVLLRDRLCQAIELAGRGRRRLAVMFLDLDRFKTINDSLGHGVGDLLLQLVARRLVACVRRSDTVSRQGGDEFVLMFPEIEQADDAGLFAQKILLAMAAPPPGRAPRPACRGEHWHRHLSRRRRRRRQPDPPRRHRHVPRQGERPQHLLLSSSRR